MALQIAADYSWAVWGFGRNTRKSAAQESKGSSRKRWEAGAQWLDPSPFLSASGPIWLRLRKFRPLSQNEAADGDGGGFSSTALDWAFA